MLAKKRLDAREERSYLQEKLIEKYGNSLVVVRCNYPGQEKNNLIAHEVVNEFYRILKKNYLQEILNMEKLESLEGLSYLMSLKKEKTLLKKELIKLEESHPLGRLIDLDVIDSSGGISRKDLGYSGRLCLICKNEAHYCVRSRKHSLKEVLEAIEERYNSWKNYKLDNSNVLEEG